MLGVESDRAGRGIVVERSAPVPLQPFVVQTFGDRAEAERYLARIELALRHCPRCRAAVGWCPGCRQVSLHGLRGRCEGACPRRGCYLRCVGCGESVTPELSGILTDGFVVERWRPYQRALPLHLFAKDQYGAAGI